MITLYALAYSKGSKPLFVGRKNSREYDIEKSLRFREKITAQRFQSNNKLHFYEPEAHSFDYTKEHLEELEKMDLLL